MTVPVHAFLVSWRASQNPRAVGLLQDAQALGFSNLTQIQVHDLYFVQGRLTEQDLERLAMELLSDPVAQTFCLRGPARGDEQVIERALRPGVTDSVAEQIVRGAHELGIAGVVRAATGQRFVIQTPRPLSETELHDLAHRLLVNPVIHRYTLGPIEGLFPEDAQASEEVLVLPLRELADDGLAALSEERRAALDVDEMRAIQRYYRTLGRDPTDVEFETIAQTWSEHCSHKTFRAQIEWDNGAEPIDGLLKTFIRSVTEEIAAPWVRSAFVDNAGIIDLDDEHEVSFKIETHNHPSAIEPFGGANTGTGGVIRDILGVSAKPIAATDVLCFGPQDLPPDRLPEGVMHPRRIRSGVVAGVQDYGNKIGLPTVSGAVLYDEGYSANPLVFCGCVGLAPKNSHPRQPRPGDRVIVLGGRTGRDGLRGATFSSMTMDARTGQVAGASVQIGDPITEKGVIEVVIRARDRHLYHAITDCGAGGLSSAVGEMAKDVGAEVDLKQVRLKYSGLAPWEIWLSEAQERMVLAVPESNRRALQELCGIFDVELTDIGAFTETGHLTVRQGDRVVLDLDNDFLFAGMPQRRLRAALPTRPPVRKTSGTFQPDWRKILLALLSHPNIASKADIIRVYDHEVQGGTVVKPLTGARNDGPSDACVLKPFGTAGTQGIVLACGVNPEFGKVDPYRMALSVVDEAVRNAVAVGADPERIALLDNFCWGDPRRPETLGGLVEAARGCRDAARHYRTPFISGKDSLNNEYLGTDGLRHAIPPTLLVSALGLIQDVNLAVTMDLKQAGNVIYLLGANEENAVGWGGNHIYLVEPAFRVDAGNEKAATESVPGLARQAPELYRALHRAMRAGLVRACHDLSEGGMAVAAAEMCIAGRLGMSLCAAEGEGPSGFFVEGNGRLLAEVRPGDCSAFEACFDALPRRILRVGQVTDDDRLTFLVDSGQDAWSVSVGELVASWNGKRSSDQGRDGWPEAV